LEDLILLYCNFWPNILGVPRRHILAIMGCRH